MKKIIVMILSFFIVFGINAQSKSSYKKITSEESQKMIDAGDVTILDVRTKQEYDAGHIPEAILLPDFEIKSKAEKILTDKNAVILVYCRSGVRSSGAAKNLVTLGYTKIYDFGGIINWKGEVVK